MAAPATYNEAVFFGSGVLYLKTSGGQNIRVAEMTGCTLDFSATTKELKGSSVFSLAQAITGRKISAKIDHVKVNGLLWNTVMGGTAAAGSKILYEETKTAAASVAITPPNSGTWADDYGVVDATGDLMLKVTSNPAVGSYAVSAGTYTFNAGESGSLKIAYEYSLTSGETIDVDNAAMGLVTPLACRFQDQFTDSTGTRTIGFYFPSAIVSGISLAFKNEDFVSENVGIDFMPDTSGNVFTKYIR